MDDSRENNRMLQESLFCREDGEERDAERGRRRDKREGGGGKRKGNKEMRIEDEERIDEERAHCPHSAPEPSG